MTSEEQYVHAVFKAEQVVHDNGMHSLPVDPLVIAKNCGIDVVAKPESNKGVSGMLIRVGNNFAIAYATHNTSVPFQRFSIAHELGHYYLPGHGEAVLDGHGIHESRAGFNSSTFHEIEADHFAGGLLMPRKLFIPGIEKAGEGIAAVKSLSTLCNTSLIATAIRLTQCAQYPIAIVVSTKDKINYCFMSDSLKEIPGITWIAKGRDLPKTSLTCEFNRSDGNVQNALQNECASDLQDWFGGKGNIGMREDVIGLGSYGKTLTVLHGIVVPDDEEDEDELNESWTPRFKR